MTIVGRTARARRLMGVAAIGTTTLLAVACNPPPPPPTPSAEYQFEGTQGDGAKACANAYGPDLRTTDPSNPNLFFFQREAVDGVNDGVTVFSPGIGTLLAPTSGEVGNGAEYTIIMLFRLRDVSSYKRLVDFKGGTSDDGLYVHDGKLVFYGSGVAEGSKTIVNGEWTQVIITRSLGSGSPYVYGYLDGEQQWSFKDSLNKAQIINDLRFFKDNTSGGSTGEESGGALARLRLYNQAYGPSIGDTQTPSTACST